MAGPDSFRERLRQTFDRIAEMEIAEWRCRLERARADLVDGMTARTVGAHEGHAALVGGRLRHSSGWKGDRSDSHAELDEDTRGIPDHDWPPLLRPSRSAFNAISVYVFMQYSFQAELPGFWSRS